MANVTSIISVIILLGGLVAAAMLIWSLRLGGHIARRSLESDDDPRYARLREGYGTQARWQMFLLTQKQIGRAHV